MSRIVMLLFLLVPVLFLVINGLCFWAILINPDFNDPTRLAMAATILIMDLFIVAVGAAALSDLTQQ